MGTHAGAHEEAQASALRQVTDDVARRIVFEVSKWPVDPTRDLEGIV